MKLSEIIANINAGVRVQQYSVTRLEGHDSDILANYTGTLTYNNRLLGLRAIADTRENYLDVFFSVDAIKPIAGSSQYDIDSSAEANATALAFKDIVAEASRNDEDLDELLAQYGYSKVQ